MKGARRRSNTPLYLGLGAIALLGIGALAYLSGSRGGRQSYAVDPSLPPVQSEGYVLGRPSAPVEVLEFADFECPACGQFATVTEPDVRQRLVNTGQVRMRFVDFPLNIHRNTWAASHAAACANDQGKFWEMHDLIFQNQDRWSGEATRNPERVLRPLAQQLGLDLAKYDQCIESRTHQAKIQAHLRRAEQMGIQSTPTFVIGGKVIPGALSYDEFKRYVDEAARSAPAAGARPGAARVDSPPPPAAVPGSSPSPSARP